MARERLKLLYDAGVGIGTTLDVTRTAQELAEVAVPRFADFVTVDLAHAVLTGEEPEQGTSPRRTAFCGIRQDVPLYPVGEEITFVPSSPQARSLSTGQAHLEPDLGLAPLVEGSGSGALGAGRGVRHPLTDHRPAAGGLAGDGCGQLLALGEAGALRR